MEPQAIEKVCDLLGTGQIPGSEGEKRILCIRIAELVALNGEQWVRLNKERLLKDWELVVSRGMIGPEGSDEKTAIKRGKREKTK